MALKKTFSFTGQKTVSGDFWSIESVADSVVIDCYIKVQSVSGNKELAKAQVSFISDKFVGFKSYDFPVNLDGENFIKQAYEHLKSLEEFAGSINC
jgi:hypothetical protein